MSAVVSGVKAKLDLRLPGQIGTNKQWSDSYIESLCLAAAHAACERIGYQWVSEEISLVDDTHEYAVASKFIEIVTVEFALDGSNYEQHLTPATLQELDAISRRWRLDRGQRPERYVLISAPGHQPSAVGGSNGSRIIVYRPLSTAGSSTIRLSGWGIGTASSNVPGDVQERVHVPYVMAVLKAPQDPGLAMRNYRKFVIECDKLRGRFQQPYADGTRQWDGSIGWR